MHPCQPGAPGLQSSLHFQLKGILSVNMLLGQKVTTSLVAPALLHSQPGGVLIQKPQNHRLPPDLELSNERSSTSGFYEYTANTWLSPVLLLIETYASIKLKLG